MGCLCGAKKAASSDKLDKKKQAAVKTAPPKKIEIPEEVDPELEKFLNFELVLPVKSDSIRSFEFEQCVQQ